MDNDKNELENINSNIDYDNLKEETGAINTEEHFKENGLVTKLKDKKGILGAVGAFLLILLKLKLFYF